MNIGVVVKEYPPEVIGGTETQTMRMATELQHRTEHDVTVYTKKYSQEDPHDPDFHLVRVPNWRINDFVSTLTFMVMVIIFLLRDRQKIDVLQCMMIYPVGFGGYIVHIFTGLPYFAWIRGGDYYFMKNHRLKRWAISRVLEDTEVLVQTQAVKSDVQKEFPNASLVVLGNGVDIPEHTANGNKVVYTGRLKNQKGVHILLKAMEGIENELLIVGDGPERHRFEQIAGELDVTVNFVGEVEPNEVQQYLFQGSVFVLPSVTGEGLPNSILEAMAVGLAVIGTDTGGVRNVIEEGKNGYVVEPNNVEELRTQLIMLLEDSDRREKMGKNAREFVSDEYSWPHIISKLELIYGQIADRNVANLQ